MSHQLSPTAPHHTHIQQQQCHDLIIIYLCDFVIFGFVRALLFSLLFSPFKQSATFEIDGLLILVVVVFADDNRTHRPTLLIMTCTIPSVLCAERACNSYAMCAYVYMHVYIICMRIYVFVIARFRIRNCIRFEYKLKINNCP